ncbi:MAG TPA: rhamnose ABC transporter substrate-binding protein [Chloroflexota bacterium]|nr:rhamnose ABC transporter substrate-binding protein [Chloroflexota bacterium]
MLPRKRILLPLALLLPACVALTPRATPSPAHAGGFKIAFIPKAVGNPYFDTAFAGAKLAAKANGDTVLQVGPATADAAGQVTFINNLIQQHVDAIAISADDPAVIAPALERAESHGIKVVSYDSDTLPKARSVFINQANSEQIGRVEIQIIGREINYKGQIAIISGAATATNQNTWIGWMRKELALPKYKNMSLVTIDYGNDDITLSTTEATGLLTKYPNLKGIVAPTTVGIKAAAQVITIQGKIGKVFVTGLGTPNDMRKYVLNGSVPDFALWDVGHLGYLAETTAHDLAAGSLKANVGATYTAGMLGKYTIGMGGVVLLGPPTEFTKHNIGNFHF